ncbi:MAG: hypothetical protein K0Q81_1470, partial [Paenibacillus sp.]|nr:hypothetical protein [Paenibacillus sp.]
VPHHVMPYHSPYAAGFPPYGWVGPGQMMPYGYGHPGHGDWVKKDCNCHENHPVAAAATDKKAKISVSDQQPVNASTKSSNSRSARKNKISSSQSQKKSNGPWTRG